MQNDTSSKKIHNAGSSHDAHKNQDKMQELNQNYNEEVCSKRINLQAENPSLCAGDQQNIHGKTVGKAKANSNSNEINIQQVNHDTKNHPNTNNKKRIAMLLHNL